MAPHWESEAARAAEEIQRLECRISGLLAELQGAIVQRDDARSRNATLMRQLNATASRASEADAKRDEAERHTIQVMRQLADATDALRWYADLASYDDGAPGEDTLDGQWELDEGDRARDALKAMGVQLDGGE